jgi:FdhE protein
MAATVRVLSAEEIAARAGGEAPYLHWPERATVFAEREMRLRQLARSHPMGDFLAFLASIAHAQHEQLLAYPKAHPSLPMPDAAALDRAAREGRPPLPATDWPRDPAWQHSLRAIVQAVRTQAPPAAQPAFEALLGADADALERQADCLLTGVMVGLDLAAAPLVAAALQVYWTHLLLEVQARHRSGGSAIGRLDDETLCPACGSKPTASITRSSGESLGQRYLHCSLCSLQWHMVRIKCPHCRSGRKLAYFSLDVAAANDPQPALSRSADDGSGDPARHLDRLENLDEPGAARAAQATVQAEACDDCGHYLKIVHSDRDPMVEPVADDLASLPLDLLVAEQTGKLRHGVNLMLLFGAPGDDALPAPEGGGDGPGPLDVLDPSPPDGAPPPDPGAF